MIRAFFGALGDSSAKAMFLALDVRFSICELAADSLLSNNIGKRNGSVFWRSSNLANRDLVSAMRSLISFDGAYDLPLIFGKSAAL